jgi:NADH-quinone oxidoreductase subunit E
VEALRAVQSHRGWVSDQAVCDIAELLGLTAEEVESVATFYSMIFREPVGRHVIYLCDSVSCWIMGAESLMEHLRQKLGVAPGETTRDGRFTLLPVGCLGACDLAPAMQVDDDLHGNLTPESVDEILERYA